LGKTLSDHTPTTLRQRQEWRETMELTLADDELFFTARCGGMEGSTRVPVADIDDLTWEAPNAKGRGWLYAAVIFGAVAGIVLFGYITSGVPGLLKSRNLLGLSAAMLPLVAIAAFSFWMWRRLKRRTYIQLFRRSSGDAICGIRADDPSPEEVARFVERVTADARRISLEGEEQAWVSASRLHAPREIRRFHDLMNEGILTPDEFASKKKALIEGFLAE
jgi:hypothetical protein